MLTKTQTGIIVNESIRYWNNVFLKELVTPINPVEVLYYLHKRFLLMVIKN